MRRSRETAVAFALAERLAEAVPDVCAVRRGMVILAAETLWKPHSALSSEIRTNVQCLEHACAASLIFPCYFGVDTAFTQKLNEQFHGEYRSTPLGAEGIWNLEDWGQTQANNKAVRNSIHAALRQGLEVREHSWEEVVQVYCLRSKFQSVLHNWQAAKHLPTLGFVAESDIFRETECCAEQPRRLFGAWRGDELLGYVSGYSRLGDNVWYADQFIRHPAAPVGTMEMCIDVAFRAAREAGTESATLGLMPLARVNTEKTPFVVLNNNFSRLLRFGALLGQHWYNVHGLTRFKQKFLPHRTTPMFFCSHRSLPTGRLTLGLIEAFCGTSWHKAGSFFSR